MKSQYHNLVPFSLVFFITLVFVSYRYCTATEMCEIKREFSFIAENYAPSAVQPKIHILVRKHLKGSIMEIVCDNKTKKIVLAITEYSDDIEKEFRVPDIDIPPYAIEFIPKYEESLLDTRFVGPQDPNTIVSDVQLRLAFQILEMAMMDVRSSTFRTNQEKQLVMEIDVFEYYDFGAGITDIRKIRGSRKATSFKATPMFEKRQLTRYILQNYEMDAITLRMSTRTMDYATGRFTRAVDLSCAFDRQPDGKIDSILIMLNDPTQFKYYYYYELNIGEN